MKQQHAFVVLHFVDGPWALLSHPATPGYQRCLFHIHLNFVNHAPTPQSVLSTSSSDSRDSEPVDFTVSEPGRKSSLFVSSEAGMAECWDVDSLGYERSDQDSVLAVLVWRMMKTLLPFLLIGKKLQTYGKVFDCTFQTEQVYSSPGNAFHGYLSKSSDWIRACYLFISWINSAEMSQSVK